MNKIKKCISKTFVLKFLIIINIIITIILLLWPIKIGVSSNNSLSREFFPSEKLKNDTSYMQEITCDINYLDSIGIKLSTYLVDNKDGKIKIKILNENKKNIYEESIPLKEIVDNEIHYFKFPEIKKSKGKKYIFNFEYEEFKNGNSLAYWYTTQDVSNRLKINDEIIPQEIFIVLTGEEEDYFMAWYPTFIAIILYAMLVIIEGEYNDKK